MPDLRKSSSPAKALAKVKKTLADLLGDGQLKTGKTVLDEKAQKAKEQEVFLAAAQEEERMRSYRVRQTDNSANSR
jgi:hypothetical protein